MKRTETLISQITKPSSNKLKDLNEQYRIIKEKIIFNKEKDVTRQEQIIIKQQEIGK
jgi:hypothetical protein